MSGSGGGNEVEESRYERELARISIDRWNDYQERFVPLENQLMDEVRSTDAEYDQAGGWANAASEQQFSRARGQLTDNLLASGANPSSGAFAANRGDLASDEALATGLNQAGAGQALSNQEVYGLAGITELGRGNSTTAFEQYGNAANSAQDQAISDASNALSDRLSSRQAVGQGVGLAAGYALNQPSPGKKPKFGTDAQGMQSGNYGYGLPSSGRTIG